MLRLLHDILHHNCGHRQLTHTVRRFATVCSYRQRYRKNKYNSAAWSSAAETIFPQILWDAGWRAERGIYMCVYGWGDLDGLEDLNGEGVLRWPVNGEGGSEDQRRGKCVCGGLWMLCWRTDECVNSRSEQGLRKAVLYRPDVFLKETMEKRLI